jgi:putative transposase
MRRGILYLVGVMDWPTRKVLVWRGSNAMDVEFCMEALEEALARFDRPEIDQYGPRQPVRLTTVHRCAAGSWGEYFDGWAGSLDG